MQTNMLRVDEPANSFQQLGIIVGKRMKRYNVTFRRLRNCSYDSLS